jgi:hypothetical protein
MPSQRTNRELWLSFIAIVFVTFTYLFMVVWQGDVPRAREFYGHSIGILGFVMMLMTETLYSLRKRSRSARWGRMADWLQFHIFTGIVGPYLVLLHTSWKFNGLAGVVMLLTVVVVGSGFLGRYIYTAVPRTADGVEVEARQLEEQIAEADTALQSWFNAPESALRDLARNFSSAPAGSAGQLSLVVGRGILDWNYQLNWWLERRRLDGRQRAKARQLEKLVSRRRALEIQLASLTVARRMLALWHAIHIPLGMVLFSAAIIHIVAAVYYATLLR